MGIKEDREASLARLHKAAEEGRKEFESGPDSKLFAAQNALNDQVVDMLVTGGTIQLRGKDGKMYGVRIKGLGDE